MTILFKMDKTTTLLTLKNLPKIGNVTAKKIFESIYDENDDLNELFNKLSSISRINNFEILNNAYLKSKNLIKQLENSDIKLINYLDEKYPKSFLKINDPPVLLFYIGDISIASKPCITIVGTRKPSDKGKEIAYNISSKLCKDNIIVSGLAEGVDTEVHKAVVDNKLKTIAVLAHGLDMIFPQSNSELSKKIIDNGGLLISEYELGQSFSRYTFVARDRLQSALSEKVIIIETNLDGGTMHTAKKAFEYNKEVFVFKSNTNQIPLGNLKLLELGAKPFDEKLEI